MEKNSMIKNLCDDLKTKEIYEEFKELDSLKGYEHFKHVYKLYFMNEKSERRELNDSKLKEVYEIMVECGYDENEEYFNLGLVNDVCETTMYSCSDIRDEKAMIAAGKEAVVGNLANSMFYFLNKLDEYVA